MIRIFEVLNGKMNWTGVTIANKRNIERAMRDHSLDNPGIPFVAAEVDGRGNVEHVLMSATSGQITATQYAYA